MGKGQSSQVSIPFLFHGVLLIMLTLFITLGTSILTFGKEEVISLELM